MALDPQVSLPQDLGIGFIESVNGPVHHRDHTGIGSAASGLPRQADGQVGVTVGIEVSGGQGRAEPVADLG